MAALGNAVVAPVLSPEELTVRDVLNAPEL